MRCPKCAQSDDKVIDSRLLPGERITRRRRECLNCGTRFTTHEELLRQEIMVLKRDTRREPFSKSKLEGGIRSACQKRPISTEQIHAIVEDIAGHFEHELLSEVSTEQIGELVMNHLKKLDKVAYVRFASVYGRFEDILQFIHTVQDIAPKKGAKKC